jgi:hypothetical protein
LPFVGEHRAVIQISEFGALRNDCAPVLFDFAHHRIACVVWSVACSSGWQLGCVEQEKEGKKGKITNREGTAL